MLKKSLLSIAITISMFQVALAEKEINLPKKIHERELVLYSYSDDSDIEQPYQAFINKSSLVKNGKISSFDIVVNSLQIDDDKKEKESIYSNQEIDIKNDEIIIPTKFNCKTEDVNSSKFIYINKETNMIVERPIAPEMVAKPNTPQEKADMAILKKTVCE